MRFSKLVTDVKSSSWAGRIVRTTISQRLALDIIQVSFWESIILKLCHIFQVNMFTDAVKICMCL